MSFSSSFGRLSSYYFTTMPSMEWFTKYTNPFPRLFHAETMEASTATQTQTSSIPTLSFDLEAPTGSSSGWKVKNVWGVDADNPSDFAKQLQDILNRTETYSVLNTLFYRHIIAVLVVVWSAMLWRKLRSVDAGFSWPDALGAVACVASVVWRDMALAIGVTAGYAAWVVLADRPWNGKGGLPSFEAFVEGLKPADNEDEEGSREKRAADPQTATPPAEPGAEAEAARLTNIEAKLGLPEKKPQEDCVVCWASDDSPLKLPCSHLVCSDCLLRLKEANRYTCPFCRRPLYTLATNKVALFQLVAASSGAQLALALVLTALRTARGQYWGAAICLLSKGYPAAAALWGQWGIRTQGEEGYFASTSERFLQIQLGLSIYLARAVYASMDEVGWATFVDGRWVCAGADEWRDLRHFVCWAVPGVAGKVVRCP